MNEKEPDIHQEPTDPADPPEPRQSAAHIHYSDAEEHYRNLTAFFKDMVSTAQFLIVTVTLLVGVLSGLGIYFSYRSVADMKAEVRQSLDGVRSDAKLAIDSSTGVARSAIEDTRTNTRESLEQTKTMAEAQAAQVRERSAGIALGEAQRRVDEAFHGDNVQAMVERAAKSQVAPVIERQLQTEVDRAMDSVQLDLEWLAKILDASGYMRGGSRSGMERLQSIQRNAPTERIRQRASTLFDTIAKEYEQFVKDEAKEGGFTSVLQSRYGTQSNEPQVIPELVATIRSEKMLSEVAIAFVALSERTGQDFRMFDFDAVSKWCAQQSPRCEK